MEPSCVNRSKRLKETFKITLRVDTNTSFIYMDIYIYYVCDIKGEKKISSQSTNKNVDFEDIWEKERRGSWLYGIYCFKYFINLCRLPSW